MRCTSAFFSKSKLAVVKQLIRFKVAPVSCEFNSVSNSLLRVGKIEIGLWLELTVGFPFFKYWGKAVATQRDRDVRADLSQLEPAHGNLRS